jgi:hypothetical protein
MQCHAVLDRVTLGCDVPDVPCCALLQHCITLLFCAVLDAPCCAVPCCVLLCLTGADVAAGSMASKPPRVLVIPELRNLDVGLWEGQSTKLVR